MARTGDFDLAAALAQPSFTPGRRDAAALAALVASGNERAPKALASLGGEVVRGVVGPAFDAADEGGRARLVQVLGLVARAGDADAVDRLIAFVAHDQPRVRRAAISAIGKLAPTDALREVLLARWQIAGAPPEETRTLAEALGKLGGDAALASLRTLDAGDDKELVRRRDRAVMMADRDAKRGEASEIALDVAPPSPLVVRLHCRQGLGGLLTDEARACGFAVLRTFDHAIDVTLDRPWGALHAMRLWATAGIRIAMESLSPAHLVDTIVSPRVRGIITAWTRGAIRWRLGFAHGHRRAVVWKVAQGVMAKAPELVNDPTSTSWDLLVDDATGALELVPKKAADPRFAWRVAEVPAASHPTIAAALARVAGVRADDVVWDPFCGSGSELVERARLGAYASLLGSDLDETALEATRANCAAAGVEARLFAADARAFSCHPASLVITNPPLGSRVQVDAGALLVECLENIARQLGPGGRLVWITPAARRTTPAAERLGLVRSFGIAVDLGGVRGHLERWDKR